MSAPLKQLQKYSIGLFERLEEFFVRATGETAQNFSSVEDFDNVIRARASQIAPRGRSAFMWLDNEVRQYQANEGISAFKAAKELGGM